MNASATTITKTTSSQQTTSSSQAAPANTKITPSTQSTPISICIITKNECDTLRQCLTCLKPYADAGKHEIVVVDTGSTDNTVEMCKEFTDKIYYFEWINDFSAARNYAAEKASHDWILCIDSDEFVTEWDEKSVQTFVSSSKNTIGNLLLKNTCGSGSGQYESISKLPRIYNKTIYHFMQPVHEQLFPYADTRHIFSDIKIHLDHHSYAGTPQELRKKSKRNIDLLMKEYNKNPHNPYILFQLGQSYYMIEDFETANHYYSLGLAEDVNPDLDYVRTMVVSYGYTLINLKQYQKALELEGLYETFGDRADFVFLMGIIYLNNALFDEAIAQFKRATTFKTAEVVGANSFRAWYNIGVIYECAGMKKPAIEYYQKCGDYAPAQKRLTIINN